MPDADYQPSKPFPLNTMKTSNRHFALCLMLLIALLPLGAQQTSPCAQWMAEIPDATPIRCLSIPGTHDSGAIAGNVFVKVQDAGIAGQLEMGIRVFDVRLKADSEPGVTADEETGDGATTLGVYHAGQYMNQTWEAEVLPTLQEFLRLHPQEFLIVLLKCEGGNRTAFERILRESLARAEAWAVDYDSELSLGQCRGRMLFLLRDEVEGCPHTARLHGWKDDATCRISIRGSNGRSGTASVEDEYAFETLTAAHYKTLTALRHTAAAALHTSNAGGEPCWFFTFASAHAIPNNSAEQFADCVNPALLQGLADIEGPSGILLIDFAHRHHDLVKLTIERCKNTCR